jgi:cell division transport system permease protein
MARIWNSFSFALASALQNFWRNKAVSLAAVAIMTLVLVVMGMGLVMMHAMDRIVQEQKVKASSVSVFIADNTPLASTMDMKLRLEADQRVKQVSFVSKQEALEKFRRFPSLPGDIIGALEGNPLPQSLDVDVKDLGYLKEIDALVRTSPIVDKEPATNFQAQLVDKILTIARVIGIIGIGILAGLTAVAIFIIMFTIRTAVYVRRKEIEVMKLVGATDWFVRWPFLLEGIFSGLLAAGAATALVALGYPPAYQKFHGSLSFIPLDYDPLFVRTVVMAMLAFGTALGAFGSYLGLRRHLAA